MSPRRRRAGGLLLALACLVLGALAALAGLAAHTMTWAGVPAGFLLAAVAPVLVTHVLLLHRRPASALAWVAGWLVVFGLGWSGRPEGDYVLAAEAAGYGMALVALVLVAQAAWAVATMRRSPDGASGPIS